MSIGDKLKILRKQKGISQQELASYLNISRQTISKFEHDLSLPDMNLMIKICEYYHISVNELLGIQENDNNSITDLYEQIQVVSLNIQRSNRKVRIINMILIIIAVISLCLSLFVVNKLHNYDLLIQGISQSHSSFNKYINIVNNDNNLFDSVNQDTYMKAEKYDLNKQTVTLNYQFCLRNYTKNTQVKISFEDYDQKKEYKLKKINDYTFQLHQEVKLINYSKVILIIDNGKDIINETLSEQGNCDYLSHILKEYVYLYVPLDSQNRLVLNTVIYAPKEHKSSDHMIGDFQKGTILLTMYKADKKTQIKSTSMSLGEKKELKLLEDIPLNEDVYIAVAVKFEDKYSTSMHYLYGNIKDQSYESYDTFKIKEQNQRFEIYPKQKY